VVAGDGHCRSPPRGERRWAVGISDVGTRFAAANISTGIRMTVVDTATGYEVRSIPLRTLAFGSGHTVEFSRDGNRLLTTDSTGEIRVWDLRDSVVRRQLFADAPAIRGIQEPLAVSRDGRFLAVRVLRTVQRPNQKPRPGYAIDQIDLRTGRRIPMDYPGFRERIEHAEYSPDGRWIGLLLTASQTLVADSTQHSVLYVTVVLDAAKGEIAYPGKSIRLVRHDLSSRSVKAPRIGFAPDGTFLMATYSFAKEGPAYSGHWDVEDVAAEKVVFSTTVGMDHDIQFVPGGTRALVASREGRYVELWDMPSKQRLWHEAAKPDDAGQSSATFSPDGRRLLTCEVPGQAYFPRVLTGISRRATIRDTETGREVSTLTLPSVANVGMLKFTPDGQRVLAYSTNATRQFAMVYNADSGRPLLDLDGMDQTSVVREGVFTPDGRYITQDWGPVRGGTGSKLRVWDGRDNPPAWSPGRSVDDLLADAHKLCDDPDPAKRNPAAAVSLTTPAVTAYPNDFECLGAHGLALLLAGKDEDALAALTRQKDHLEQQASLIVVGAKNSGKTSQPRDRVPPLLVAQIEYLLAAAYHRLGHAAEARAAFDTAEEMMGRTVVLPNISRSVAAIGTPYPDVAQRPRAERYREIAVAILGIKDRPVPPLKVEAPKPIESDDHPAARLNRAQFLLKHRGLDPAIAVHIADDLLAGKLIDGVTYYNVACVYARASGVVTGAATKGKYADRAVETLRLAVENGFVEQHDRSEQGRNAYEQFQTDEDLDPLRNRADYKKLEAEVAAKEPPREKAPPPREIRK
jgi:WD40 repeat protein